MRTIILYTNLNDIIPVITIELDYE
jgi:hypothetical protein